MRVEVVRSAKRRKTVSARVIDGVLHVRLPAWMDAAEEARWVDEMRKRYQRQRNTDAIDLTRRAATLADRYELPRPATIRWVDNQTSRWGSCTPVDRSIRISSRLAPWPSWVLDYVVVHELAHLVELGHTDRFRALEARYPMAERAIGFLLAKGWDPEDEDGDTEPAPGQQSFFGDDVGEAAR